MGPQGYIADREASSVEPRHKPEPAPVVRVKMGEGVVIAADDGSEAVNATFDGAQSNKAVFVLAGANPFRTGDRVQLQFFTGKKVRGVSAGIMWKQDGQKIVIKTDRA